MRRRLLLVALPCALLVNVVLLGLAPLLSHERKPPAEDEFASAVSLVKLAPPKPPEPEEKKEPEPPPPPEPDDFKPDLIKPQLSSLLGADIGGIAIDLGGMRDDSFEQEIVFEAYELDQPPQPVVKTPPAYPYRAREQGIEGVVQIRFLVRADGSVGQVLIVDARPEGVFEQEVLKAVPQWKFTPGKVGGQAVTAWVVTAVQFKL
jgi:protein TonB